MTVVRILALITAASSVAVLLKSKGLPQ